MLVLDAVQGVDPHSDSTKSSSSMPTQPRGPAPASPGKTAREEEEQHSALQLPHLPPGVWQHIARAALAAEDGDPRAWARLSAVNSLWCAGLRCAVVQAEDVPAHRAVPETPVTVRFARPSTAEQRAWLLRTPLRLRGVHFNRQDRYAAELLRLEDFACLHGPQLAALRGLCCPASMNHGGECPLEREMEGWDPFDEPPEPGALSLMRYTGIRALTLCRVLGQFAPCAPRLPALPAGLLDLTLDGGPGKVVHMSTAARSVDLRHLTALTRLTLVRLTPAVLEAGLLGCRSEGDTRLPPRLDTLRLVERTDGPDEEIGNNDMDHNYARRCINLGVALRSRPPSLPPARFPTLSLRADQILCGNLDPWDAQPAAGAHTLPRAIRLRTQCLSLSPPGCQPVASADTTFNISYFYGRCWITPRDANPVHAVTALCEMVRRMPPGVEELGLGFADRQPLLLRLQLHMGVEGSDLATCHHEVSFKTAAELAEALRQRADESSLSCRLVIDSDVEYVVLSRLTGATAVESAAGAGAAVCGYASTAGAESRLDAGHFFC